MLIYLFDALKESEQSTILEYKCFKGDRNQTEEQQEIARKAQSYERKMKGWYTDIGNKCFPQTVFPVSEKAMQYATSTPAASKNFNIAIFTMTFIIRYIFKKKRGKHPLQKKRKKLRSVTTTQTRLLTI